MSVPAETWVQIRATLIPPGQRARGVPPETAERPLEMRVRGFLTHDADPGDEVTILTMAEREVRGKLVDPDPRYEHGFGRPDPALQHIGMRARATLRAARSES